MTEAIEVIFILFQQHSLDIIEMLKCLTKNNGRVYDGIICRKSMLMTLQTNLTDIRKLFNGSWFANFWHCSVFDQKYAKILASRIYSVTKSCQGSWAFQEFLNFIPIKTFQVAIISLNETLIKTRKFLLNNDDTRNYLSLYPIS